MATAFEITEQDIENVLRANAVKVANSGGKPFASMAEEIFADFVEADRVEVAALEGGTDLDA